MSFARVFRTSGRIVLPSLALLATCRVAASPNLDLDDPVYLELAQLRAAGRLPAYLGGLRPLSETRALELLLAAGAQPDSRLLALDVEGWWLRPLGQATVRLSGAVDSGRSYSTVARPRDVTGDILVSCEHEAGRPCGDGARLTLELDSAAGYATWFSAATRMRIGGGSEPYGAEVTLDRAYAQLEIGPLAVEVGRDVLLLGPAARTQVLWSDNSAPLDQVRLGTARPLDVLGADGAIARISAMYFLGRLRAPQTFDGTLVSGIRLQADLVRALELGVTHVVELGGDGAPAFDFWDFVLENFHRKAEGAYGISNHRLSFDASLLLPQIRGARIYYEVAFEDTRNQILDAFLYDADHVVGLELATLTAAGRHGLVLEYLHDGYRSQEHRVFNGLTQAGRLIGAPLGPDAWSLFAKGRLDLDWATLWPSLELARLYSDQWAEADDGIHHVADGVTETRFRLGLGLTLRQGSLRLDLRAFFEHVASFAFEPGSTRENYGGSAALVWIPGKR